MAKIQLPKMQTILPKCCGKEFEAGKSVTRDSGRSVVEHMTPRKGATKELENFMPECQMYNHIPHPTSGKKLDITSK